ncbi:hypothetical protein ACWFR1_32760 [Streptomyces sp. NPDC055103]
MKARSPSSRGTDRHRRLERLRTGLSCTRPRFTDGSSDERLPIMLIYAFRDTRGTWHGDPDAVIHDMSPGRGVLTLPTAAPGQAPGLFDGQRVEVLYATCDLEASQVSYRLEDGGSYLASWHVHELLSPAYHPADTAPATTQDTTTVKVEIAGPDRRYNVHIDFLAEGRAEIAVVVCTADGVIHGELAGEVDARDLGEISRLLAAAARTAPVSAVTTASASALTTASASALTTAPASALTTAPASAVKTAPAIADAPSGVKATHRGQAWTPQAVAQLQERHRAGKSPEQLAEELGRSENSIRWKLYGLKLAPYPGDLVPAPRPPAEPEEPKAYTVEEKRQLYPHAYKPWKPEDEERLAERCAQGASLPELAREFGRNEGAIASRLLKIRAEGPAMEEAWEYGG